MASADELLGVLQNVKDHSFIDENERVRVQGALLAALRRVQRPFDVALEHNWIHPATSAYIKTLIDVEFWKKWVDAGGKPASCAELSALSGVDAALLRKMLRFLAAQELILDQTGNGAMYELTNFGRELAGPFFPATYQNYYLTTAGVAANFPNFSAKNNYQNPLDPTNTNFKDWAGGVDPFSFLASDLAAREAFYSCMRVVTASRQPWVEVYPTDSIVAAGTSKPGRPLLVDVGGGLGNDIEAFRLKHPDAQGLILQDLPAVIEEAIVTAPIEKQAVDILEGQPVMGARVYLLKTVLHDFPDSKAVEALRNIGRAMERGYSRILLFECMISDHTTNPLTIASDTTMMMWFSAGEREESTWRRIISDAGLQVTKIWAPDAPVSVIEIELP